MVTAATNGMLFWAFNRTPPLVYQAGLRWVWEPNSGTWI